MGFFRGLGLSVGRITLTKVIKPILVAGGVAAGGLGINYVLSIINPPVQQSSITSKSIDAGDPNTENMDINKDTGRSALNQGKLMAHLTQGLNQSLLKNFEINDEGKVVINNSKINYSGYFLRIAGSDNEPIYYVESPTQGGQIVSEGIAYGLQAVANAALLIHHSKNMKEDAKTELIKKYETVAFGLIRGALTMLNKYGNMGWRCYYSQEQKGVYFQSKDEETSASDADLIFIDALMTIKQLQNLKIFSASAAFNFPDPIKDKLTGLRMRSFGSRPNFTISSLLDFMIEGLKTYDVEVIKNKSNEIVRMFIRVGDLPSWGGPGFNHNYTVNPSYNCLNVIMKIAAYDNKDKDFWYQLVSDSFDIIKASYNFAHNLYRQIEDSKITSGDGKYVRLDGPQYKIFESLMRKIPVTDKELLALTRLSRTKANKKSKAIKPKLTNNGYYFSLIQDRSFIENQDGSFDINKNIYDLIMKKIGAYSLTNFFPDQVELGIDPETGRLTIRTNVKAANLGATEGYDAIRILIELAVYLLNYNDEAMDGVAKKFKTTHKAYALLTSYIDKKKPKDVKAGNYSNIISRISYLAAHAAVSSFNTTSQEEKAEAYTQFINELNKYISTKSVYDYIDSKGKKGPQYYNTMLFLRAASMLELAFNKKISPSIVARGKIINRTPQPLSDEPFNHILLGMEDVDYFAKMARDDILFPGILIARHVFKSDIEEKPVMAIEAERRYHYYKKAAINDKTILAQFNFAESCLGVGRYDEASEAYRNLILFTQSLKGPADQFIFTLAINRLKNILETLNVLSTEIEDRFKWFLELDHKCTRIKMILRLAYIQELNRSRRFTLAQSQENLLLVELENSKNSLSSWPNKLMEHVYNIGFSGEHGNTPIPQQAFIVQVISEIIDTAASGYSVNHFTMLPNNKTIEFPRKQYNYSDAFNLAAVILEQNHPVIEKLREKGLIKNLPSNPPIKDLLKVFEIYKSQFPTQAKAHILYKIARILQRRIFDLNDDFQRRKFSDPFHLYWLNQKDIHNSGESYEQRQANLVNEYQKIIAACSIAEYAFKQALVEEVNTTKNYQSISEIIDSWMGTLLFKLDVLKKQKDEHIQSINNLANNNEFTGDYTEEAANKKKEIVVTGFSKDYEAAIKTLKEISSSILSTFNRFNNIITGVTASLEHNFTSQPSARFDLPDKTLFSQAAGLLVNHFKSSDPRNVAQTKWLLKLSSVLVSAGAQAHKLTEFKDAILLLNSIPSIKFTNPTLPAMHIIRVINELSDVCLAAHASLHEYYRLSDNPKIKSKYKKDIEIISQLMTEIMHLVLDTNRLSTARSQLMLANNNLILAKGNNQPTTNIDNDIRRIGQKIKTISDNYISIHAFKIGVIGKEINKDSFIYSDSNDVINSFLGLAKKIGQYAPQIEELFNKDNTNNAKFLAFLGNFTWWTLMIEPGEKIILKGEKGQQTETYRTIIKALKYYREALKYDRHNLEALAGSVMLYSSLQNDRKAFSYLVKTVRTAAGGFIPDNKLRDLVSLFGLFSLDKKTSKLDQHQKNAILSIQNFLGKKKAISLYDTQIINEILRHF
ncbi:MAG: hypothetical protein FD145_281 [Candidatus Saganbacteria bacterium]|uniref:Uncharacterized protein n=1 Tax=Candidatus Saganbacteria bacterium TaxID=2575572 RepID=A0A833L2B7_UNCSA|nr:MAG: hypothetical protein FD145_281 [Candidatus Saganbacteria bacterium]